MIKVEVTFTNRQDKEETAIGSLISISVENLSYFKTVLILLDDNRVIYGDGYNELTFLEFSDQVAPPRYVTERYLNKQPNIKIQEES